MRFTGEWFKAALIRAIRTAAQVALGMLTVGMTLSEVDWKAMLSVAVVAAIYSLLTSIITDLPEVTATDGVIKIENDEYVSGVDINLDCPDIAQKNFIKLKVDGGKT